MDAEVPGAAPTKVLMIDCDQRATLLVCELLRRSWPHGVLVTQAGGLAEAVQELRDHGASCVIASAPDRESALEALLQLRSAGQPSPVIVVCEDSSDDTAIALLRAGAEDYLHRPQVSPASLQRSVQQAIERKRSEASLVHQALHDQLTGLPNRSLFLDRLTVALDRLRRSNGRVTVLFVDLDRFKDVNDTFGHAAGDQVLQIVANRLRKMLRPSDTVARFGGDEFTFVFEDVDHQRDVLALADRIRRITSVPIVLEDGECAVTPSIGIATVTDPETPPDAVLREADAAMYRMKPGRGAAGVAALERPDAAPGDAISWPEALIRAREPERDPRAGRATEAALRAAIEGRDLQVHYQPQISLHGSAGVLGLEALVRWEHPDLGSVEPAEFIPLAEETGLIVPLGRFVIERALDQLVPWRKLHPGITISVNLSPAQLGDEALMPSVADAIDRTRLEPRAISLEIPERALCQDPVAAERAIGGLKSLGVRVAIDGYGTGQSSLSKLPGAGVDSLKIDGGFVSELEREGRRSTTAGAVVDLGHALGLRVVAVGVETEEQMATLQAIGCDEAQGYFFSRPVPPEQVEAMLSLAEA